MKYSLIIPLWNEEKNISILKKLIFESDSNKVMALLSKIQSKTK